jgi:hypothetical protein
MQTTITTTAHSSTVGQNSRPARPCCK